MKRNILQDLLDKINPKDTVKEVREGWEDNYCINKCKMSYSPCSLLDNRGSLDCQHIKNIKSLLHERQNEKVEKYAKEILAALNQKKRR